MQNDVAFFFFLFLLGTWIQASVFYCMNVLLLKL